MILIKMSARRSRKKSSTNRATMTGTWRNRTSRLNWTEMTRVVSASILHSDGSNSRWKAWSKSRANQVACYPRFRPQTVLQSSCQSLQTSSNFCLSATSSTWNRLSSLGSERTRQTDTSIASSLDKRSRTARQTSMRQSWSSLKCYGCTSRRVIRLTRRRVTQNSGKHIWSRPSKKAIDARWHYYHASSPSLMSISATVPQSYLRMSWSTSTWLCSIRIPPISKARCALSSKRPFTGPCGRRGVTWRHANFRKLSKVSHLRSRKPFRQVCWWSLWCWGVVWILVRMAAFTMSSASKLTSLINAWPRAWPYGRRYVWSLRSLNNRKPSKKASPNSSPTPTAS